MKYCAGCGKQLPGHGETFCPNCGAAVAPESSASAPSASVPPLAPQQPRSGGQGRISRRTLLIAAGATVALVALIVGVVLGTRGGSSDDVTVSLPVTTVQESASTSTSTTEPPAPVAGWHRVMSDTTASLSAIAFLSQDVGVALGEDGVAHTTELGGRAWMRQFNELLFDSGDYNYQAGVIKDVAFVGEGRCLAVGEGGAIFWGKDSGKEWEDEYSQTTNNLSGVAAAGSDTAFVVGDYGLILTVGLDRETWNRCVSGVSDNLADVAFVDGLTGWTVGDNGVVLATSDGGGSWVVQDPGVTTRLNGVAFADALHGWAVGDGGVIVSTADGGLSWTSEVSGTTEALQAVEVVDAERAWIVGDGGTILATLDGGKTWTVQESGTTEDLLSLAVADGDHAWVGGTSGTILAFGTEESVAPQPAIGWAVRNTGGDFVESDVTFSDPDHVWIVGGTYEEMVTLSSSDAGGHWSYRAMTGYEDPTQVFFVDQQNGWIECEESHDSGFNDQCLLATNDGGSTWAKVSTIDEDAYYLYGALVFVDANRGWMIAATHDPRQGLYDVVLHTADGGRTWMRQYVVPEYDSPTMISITATDASHAWVVGEQGLVLSTSDGGATWVQQNCGTVRDLNSVDFADTMNGWAGGDEGIFTTTDGGRTWVLRDAAEDIADVFFVDAMNGWALGDRRAVYASKDAGVTWEEQPSSMQEATVNWYLRAVAFGDVNHGCVVASTDYGLDEFLMTDNGGW